MRQLLKAAALVIFLFPFVSCSSSNASIAKINYRIDYYSGGGFTGMESGLTIFSDGTVAFWNKKLNSEREITDSLKLTREQIEKFNELTASPELVSYSHNYHGNYTTHLIITKDIQLNDISVNGSDLPQDMPASVSNLISEIKVIFKK